MRVIATVEFDIDDDTYDLEVIKETLNEAFIENWHPDTSQLVRSWRFIKIDIPI